MKHFAMILAERRHVGLDRVERWRHDRVSALSRPSFRGPRLGNLRPNLSQRRRIAPEYTIRSGGGPTMNTSAAI